MRNHTPLLAVLLVTAATSGPVMAAEPDGIWRLREQFCVSVNAQRRCGRGREELMFFEGRAYYDDGGGWTDIGTVTTEGPKVFVNVSREGVAALVGHRIGVDVTDYLDNFSYTYRGVLRRGRIVNGRARVTLDITTDRTYRIRIRGGFVGRRIGDAFPVTPPDDEEPFELGLGSGGTGSGPAVRAGGALSAALELVDGVASSRDSGERP